MPFQSKPSRPPLDLHVLRSMDPMDAAEVVYNSEGIDYNALVTLSFTVWGEDDSWTQELCDELMTLEAADVDA